VAHRIDPRASRSGCRAFGGVCIEWNDWVALVRKVMKQTRARILRGDTRGDGKLVSLFEPETEIIRKGKAGKPTEFGKMVKLCRRRKIRSSPTTRSMIGGRMTRTC
jgi:hypothetical protein